MDPDTNLVVDCSNYTNHFKSPDVHCWYANGVRLVIPQAVAPPPGYPAGRTAEQCQALVEANMPMDVYVWDWWSLSLEDIRAKLGLVKGYPIHRLWLDCEAEDFVNGARTPRQLADQIWMGLGALNAFGAQKPSGIYSAKYWWDGYMRGITEFASAGVPLWAAVYRIPPRPSFSTFVPFGGWLACDMLQWVGTSSLCGISGIDKSIIRSNYLDPITPPGGDTVIRVGEGMQAQMAVAGDHPLFGHKFMDETDDDGQAYQVEICYGLKGKYVSANSSGNWENAGPLGGA